MNMLRTAVALALASAAPAAFGLAPGDYNTPGVNFAETYMSGATAQDRLLLAFMRVKDSGATASKAICQEGSLGVYNATVTNPLVPTGTINVATYFCSSAQDLGDVNVGDQIVFHKSADGSAFGFTPVANNLIRNYLDMAYVKANPSICSAGSVVAAVGNLSAYQPYACGARTAATGLKSVIPRAGISDVDGDAIVDPAVNAATVGKVDQNARNALVFSVVANTKFRNALQSIQGLVLNTVPANDPSRDTEAAMPSLSTTQLRGVFSTNVNNPAKPNVGDYFVDSAGVAANLSASLGNATPSPVIETIAGVPDIAGLYLCRRAVTSGTQASFATHYNFQGCVAGVSAFAGSNTSAGDASFDSGDVIKRLFSGTGSGDVEKCLAYHDSQNRWAIGILTSESEGIVGTVSITGTTNGNVGTPPSSTFSKAHRHVKVDGAAPTLINAVNGDYTHFAEQVVIKANNTSLNNYANVAAPEREVIDFIEIGLGDKDVVKAVNDAFQQGTPVAGSNEFLHPWGDSGYLLLSPKTPADEATMFATQGNTPSVASVRDLPQLRVSKFGANCKPPVATSKTPTP